MTVPPEQDAVSVNGAHVDVAQPSPNEKQPHPTDPHRWADGTLRAGNDNAVKTGVYSAAARAQAATKPSDFARQTVDDFIAGVIADMGGESELSSIELAYIEVLRDLSITRQMFVADLIRRGLFTSKGRVRSAYGQLLATVDRWDRIAQRLGTERQPKQVTPLEYWATKQEARSE
jgi:hypothetical protein